MILLRFYMSQNFHTKDWIGRECRQVACTDAQIFVIINSSIQNLRRFNTSFESNWNCVSATKNRPLLSGWVLHCREPYKMTNAALLSNFATLPPFADAATFRNSNDHRACLRLAKDPGGPGVGLRAHDRSDVREDTVRRPGADHLLHLTRHNATKACSWLASVII